MAIHINRPAGERKPKHCDAKKIRKWTSLDKAEKQL